ncbi:MAG: HAD hydrolase-like protein [Candidatus Uhrbacteria bacterium]|nr:HAD hydrolase-like protein [Candidatus Uhrbacteria bacterium]
MRRNEELVWVFDMDGTLYSNVELMWHETLKEMLKYFRDELHLPVDLSLAEQDRLRDKWNTRQTTVAYFNEFNLDFDKIVEATHLPILDMLMMEGRTGLHSIADLPGRKIVLTNSPEAFAHALLKKLGIHQYFDEVLGIRGDLQHAKPNPLSYARVVTGQRTIMVEDWEENLRLPHINGWTTVWFPESDKPRPTTFPTHVHHEIQSLAELANLV